MLRTLPLLPALLTLPGSVPATVETPEPLHRALVASIERAQEEIERNQVLWTDHSNWADPWIVRGETFQVHTTASYAFGRTLAESLDSMLPRFEQLTGLKLDLKGSDSEPLTVLVFPTLEQYNELGDNFDERSSIYGSFLATGEPGEAVATYYQPNLTLMRMWATHSALSLFVHRAGDGEPPRLWVERAVASYFASSWDYPYYVREFRRMRDAGELIDLDDLIRAPIAEYVDNPHARFIQLGMLVTYLRSCREETRTRMTGRRVDAAPFEDFLRALFAGTRPEDSAVTRLLGEDRATLQRDFFAFDAWD